MDDETKKSLIIWTIVIIIIIGLGLLAQWVMVAYPPFDMKAVPNGLNYTLLKNMSTVH